MTFIPYFDTIFTLLIYFGNYLTNYAALRLQHNVALTALLNYDVVLHIYSQRRLNLLLSFYLTFFVLVRIRPCYQCVNSSSQVRRMCFEALPICFFQEGSIMMYSCAVTVIYTLFI